MTTLSRIVVGPLLGVAVAATAATPGEVFTGNRAAILGGAATVLDGWVFCVGRAESDPFRGDDIGTGKARSFAYGALTDWVRDTSPWPADATPEDRRLSWLLLLEETPLFLSVDGMQTVHTAVPESGHYLAVMAVPESEAIAARPSAARLADVLRRFRAIQREAEAALAAPSPAAGAVPLLPPSLPERREPSGFRQTPDGTINETMSDDDI